MAEGGNHDRANHDRDTFMAISSIRELFVGRFTDEEIAILYEINDKDKFQTVDYILKADPKDVSRRIEAERKAWELVKKKKPMVPRNVLEKARTGKISTSERQFACGKRTCDIYWWRLIPDRKPVSRCEKCKTRYDPVPRDEQWGWAEFQCPRCGHEFFGFCHMKVSCPCYQCGFNSVYPTRILPPRKRDHPRNRRQKHSCNCCMGYEPGGVLRCAHPATRTKYGLPRVLVPSEEHDSTGSTVNTFLPQDDLCTKFYDVFGLSPGPGIHPIPERDEHY